MKYIKIIVIALILLIAITAFSFEPKSYTESAFLLDTYISVTVYQNHRDAAKKAIERVEKIEKMLSAFRAESEVSKINSAKSGVPVSVSDECFSLISRALFMSEQTDGAFDITIKPVMDLWGFGKKPGVPEKKALEKALGSVGYKNILLDSEKHTVTLLKEGMKVDLGGIAKGYAADCAVSVLKEAGVNSACLDFGGNVVTVGEMPLGLIDRIKNGKGTRPFTVGIQDPKGARGNIKTTYTPSSSPCAVVTSGGYERSFQENGTTYHHIIDPKTGYQPKNKIASVTVIAESSETADALSTALFVSGEAGLARVRGLYREVVFILEDGQVKKYT